MSHLLNSQSTHNYLHLLISQDTLQHFLASLYLNTSQTDSNTVEQEWGQYAVEMLLFELLVRERIELFSILSKYDKSAQVSMANILQEEEIIDEEQVDVPIKIDDASVSMETVVPPIMSPPPIASSLAKLKLLQSMKKKKDVITATIIKKTDGTATLKFDGPNKFDGNNSLSGYLLPPRSPGSSPTHSAANRSTGTSTCTSIISNLVDCSLECTSDYPAELQLQLMSNKTFRFMMDGIQNAMPLTFGSRSSPAHNRLDQHDEEVSEPEHLYLSTGISSFSMLFTVLDSVFKASFTNPSANITGILHLWNEVLQISMKRSKSKQMRTLFGTSLYSPLLSQKTQSIFLQELIAIDPTGSQTDSWCLYLYIFYLHVKCAKKIGDCLLAINCQQLFDFVTKCCELEITTSSDHRKEFAMDVIFEKFLTCLCQLNLTDCQEGSTEKNQKQGIELVFRVAVHTLSKR